MSEPTQNPPSQPSDLQRDFQTALRNQAADRFGLASSLLDRGASINGRHDFAKYRMCGPVLPWHEVTALYDAAQRDDYEAVEFLLSQGADVHAKNRSGVSPHFLPFPNRPGVETLRGLDAMRTSKNMKIVELAELRYGIEAEEEYVKRRDVFDGISGYYPRRNGVPVKPKTKRVGSVLGKGGVEKERDKRSYETGLDKQKRYDLRSREFRVAYS